MSASIRAAPTAAAVAEELALHLAVPQPLPAEPRWRAQSLTKGASGIALLHIERAHVGVGSWRTAHTWVKAAAGVQISAADDAGLHCGAPALSFALHAAGADGTARYGPALAGVDPHVTALTHRRVDLAQARIDRGDPPSFAEYDLLHGLTGIGAHLLHNAPGSDALGRVLTYLVRLTTPLRTDGETRPGWWVCHDPHLTQSGDFPAGHANLGIAHGITGPLALLAQALRRRITVDGQHAAIATICTWLDTWRHDADSGPWWPQWITRDQLRTGRPHQPGPLRPSWCYGTPGLARAQQLAAIAINDTDRQEMAEHALAGCLSDPVQHTTDIQVGRLPTDQLNPCGEKGTDPVDTHIAPHQTAQGVLAVLAGVPLHEAAARIAMAPADLADAVAVYQAAGLAALETQTATRGWYQVRIQFTDWNTAEHTAATRLGPQLRQAQDAGVLAAWWFIRKAPCWRLRTRPGPAATLADLQAALSTVLDSLINASLIDRWWETVYEPEICAFGGPHGMDIGHTLFHADSCGILDYLRHHNPTTPPENTLGRRELSVLLCGTLARSAGQDWHEHGDVWHRVAQLRPLPPNTPTDRLRDMADGLRRLMTVDTDPHGTLFGPDGPLAFIAPWAAAFDQAGRSLGDAACDGTLQRGVRDILAHHVIFHWNRLGLAARTQAVLARAAHDTVMNPPTSPPIARLTES